MIVGFVLRYKHLGGVEGLVEEFLVGSLEGCLKREDCLRIMEETEFGGHLAYTYVKAFKPEETSAAVDLIIKQVDPDLRSHLISVLPKNPFPYAGLLQILYPSDDGPDAEKIAADKGLTQPPPTSSNNINISPLKEIYLSLLHTSTLPPDILVTHPNLSPQIYTLTTSLLPPSLTLSTLVTLPSQLISSKSYSLLLPLLKSSKPSLQNFGLKSLAALCRTSPSYSPKLVSHYTSILNTSKNLHPTTLTLLPQILLSTLKIHPPSSSSIAGLLQVLLFHPLTTPLEICLSLASLSYMVESDLIEVSPVLKLLKKLTNDYTSYSGYNDSLLEFLQLPQKLSTCVSKTVKILLKIHTLNPTRSLYTTLSLYPYDLYSTSISLNYSDPNVHILISSIALHEYNLHGSSFIKPPNICSEVMKNPNVNNFKAVGMNGKLGEEWKEKFKSLMNEKEYFKILSYQKKLRSSTW
ncbi:hypothetical protein TrVE_jg12689 [Triparma verrucosa]|uniref:Uncharacterized protein n=1 Tax=Triparma verrucosa TaxID=1606542 RepID=A0A9W7C4X9_9STRA|nr:hypothetical protein TrVE_jg12689 [Triparma verrucosa]